MTVETLTTKATVLVIEDHPLVRRLLVEVLRGAYRVIQASNGLEGWSMIREFRPAVVLLDVDLPGLNGLDLCRQLKADPATYRTRVILVTARDGDADVMDGRLAGADGYVKKPFPTALLLRAVAVQLDAVAR